MSVRLWIREDGFRPRAIGIEYKAGPGPGKVVDIVGAKTADEARSVYSQSLGVVVDGRLSDEDVRALRALKRVRAVEG